MRENNLCCFFFIETAKPGRILILFHTSVSSTAPSYASLRFRHADNQTKYFNISFNLSLAKPCSRGSWRASLKLTILLNEERRLKKHPAKLFRCWKTRVTFQQVSLHNVHRIVLVVKRDNKRFCKFVILSDGE